MDRMFAQTDELMKRTFNELDNFEVSFFTYFRRRNRADRCSQVSSGGPMPVDHKERAFEAAIEVTC